MIEFPARAVAFVRDEDLEVVLLVIAEFEDGSGQRIELQRSLAFTEEDRRSGMDTYCVVSDTGATHYGGVESASLAGDVLNIRFTADAADALGVASGYRIRLGTADFVASVDEGLAEILRGDTDDLARDGRL